VPNKLTDTKASQRELYTGLKIQPTFKNIPNAYYGEAISYIILYRRNLCFSEIYTSCGPVIKTFVPTAWLIMISTSDDDDDDDDGRNMASTASSFSKSEQQANDFYMT
jgi:hypothetical protein